MKTHETPHRLLDIPKADLTGTLDDLNSVGWQVLSQPTSKLGTHFIVQYTEPSNKAPLELSEDDIQSLSAFADNDAKGNTKNVASKEFTSVKESPVSSSPSII